MEENHILLRKEEVNGVCHVSVVASYTNKDLAEISFLRHSQSVSSDVHYYLQSTQHNDTESLEVIRDHDEIYLEDDYENKFFVSVDFGNVENENGSGLEYSEVKIFGALIHQTNISEQLQKKINVECVDATSELEENK